MSMREVGGKGDARGGFSDIVRPMTPRHIRRFLLIALAVVSLPAAAQDLRPQVERLANGLTVMILEDHAQPLVSVQMLYRVGGRTENAGETGLAHFVEH